MKLVCYDNIEVGYDIMFSLCHGFSTIINFLPDFILISLALRKEVKKYASKESNCTQSPEDVRKQHIETLKVRKETLEKESSH